MTSLTKEQIDSKNKAKEKETKAPVADTYNVSKEMEKYAKPSKTQAVLAALTASTKAVKAQTLAIKALITRYDKAAVEPELKKYNDIHPILVDMVGAINSGTDKQNKTLRLLRAMAENAARDTAMADPELKKKSKTYGGLDVDIIVKPYDFSEGSPLDRAMKEIARVPYDDRHDADDFIDRTAKALAEECVVVQRADKAEPKKDFEHETAPAGDSLRVTFPDTPPDVQVTVYGLTDQVAEIYRGESDTGQDIDIFLRNKYTGKVDGVDRGDDGNIVDTRTLPDDAPISDAPKNDYLRFVDTIVSKEDNLNLAFLAAKNAVVEHVKAIRLKGDTSPNETRKSFFYLTLLNFEATLTYNRMKDQDRRPHRVTPLELIELGQCVIGLKGYDKWYILDAVVNVSANAFNKSDFNFAQISFDHFLRDSVSRLDGAAQERLYDKFVSILIEASYDLVAS